ncbi:MAG: lipopolysaccharide biosynthesis protein [Alphaproteobacteria bacterium]|nr:lipopolysaccharide biosynthesis protein [Alphaproteobacteria bacterium]
MSQEPAAEKSTAYRVAAGTALFITMRWCFRLIGLVSTVILARVLVPEDFGIFAIAASYITLIEGLTDLSVRSSVIRHGGEDRSFLDTVFTVQLLRSLLVCAVVLATSLIVPALVEDDRIGPVIWCLALNTLWSGVLSPRMALFERELDFRRELLMQFVGKILSTIAAITVALIYETYWALIVGSLVGSLSRVTTSYILAPFWPRLGLQQWRKLFNFAGWVSAATTVDTLGHQFDSIIIGGFLDVRSAGIYRVGSEFAALPLGEFLPVLSRTLFPGLLKFKDDIPKLRQNTLDAVEMICTLALPIAVGFAFVAPEVVRILYGDKWIAAIPIVQAVSLCVGIEALGGSVSTSVAMARDHTKFLFGRSVAYSLSRLPAFIIGAWLFGINGALVGYLVGSLLLAGANVTILRTLLETSYGAIATRVWRAAAGVAAMAAVLWLVPTHYGVSDGVGNDVVNIAVKMALGAATYTIVRVAIWQLSGTAEFSERSMLRVWSAVAARLPLRLGTKAGRE